jgi:hypothetical protein
MIGNGLKLTHFARLVITGDQSIPNSLTCVDVTNFNLLTFTPELNGLVEYNAVTGVFTFKNFGLVDIAATLNIDTTTGITEVEVITEYDEGAGFTKRNARTAELPIIGSKQTVLEGTLERVEPGHRIRFFVRSPNASASFKTRELDDTSVVPAAILHLKLFAK